MRTDIQIVFDCIRETKKVKEKLDCSPSGKYPNIDNSAIFNALISLKVAEKYKNISRTYRKSSIDLAMDYPWKDAGIKSDACVKKDVLMQNNVSNIISSTLALVGFIGTEKEIKNKLSLLIGRAREVSLDKHEENNGVDIGYTANLGVVCGTHLDFDIFVIETIEKKNQQRVLYITDVSFIG